MCHSIVRTMSNTRSHYWPGEVLVHMRVRVSLSTTRMDNANATYKNICRLSKKQPWCDGSHKGTPFEPLKWTVPGTKKDGKAQTLYSICACKYTQDPPYCDATHIHLPLQVLDRQDKCTKDHSPQIVGKLCASCGFRPPSEAPP